MPAGAVLCEGAARLAVGLGELILSIAVWSRDGDGLAAIVPVGRGHLDASGFALVEEKPARRICDRGRVSFKVGIALRHRAIGR